MTEWHQPPADRICQVCDLDMLPTKIYDFAYGRTVVNGPKPLCWTCYRHMFSNQIALGIAGHDRDVMTGILQSLHIATSIMVFNGAKLPGVDDDVAPEGDVCLPCSLKGLDEPATRLAGKARLERGIFVRSRSVRISVCSNHFEQSMALAEESA